MYNEDAKSFLFFALMILGGVMIFMVSQLRKRLFDAESKTNRKWFIPIIHVLAFLFLFIPAIVWSVICFPGLVLIPALAALLASHFISRCIDAEHKQQLFWLTAVIVAMWGCYGLYEYQMRLWAQTVTAPVRVDLFLVGPLLYYSGTAYYHLAKISGCFKRRDS